MNLYTKLNKKPHFNDAPVRHKQGYNRAKKSGYSPRRIRAKHDVQRSGTQNAKATPNAVEG